MHNFLKRGFSQCTLYFVEVLQKQIYILLEWGFLKSVSYFIKVSRGIVQSFIVRAGIFKARVVFHRDFWRERLVVFIMVQNGGLQACVVFDRSRWKERLESFIACWRDSQNKRYILQKFLEGVKSYFQSSGIGISNPYRGIFFSHLLSYSNF